MRLPLCDWSTSQRSHFLIPSHQSWGLQHDFCRDINIQTIVIFKWSSELNSPIWVHFSSLIPKMLTFTLAISCLITFNLPWFMDLTFKVPMQYCSLQHWTLLPSPVTSTTACCFCFGSISSSFLELFLHWSPVAYWVPGASVRNSACGKGHEEGGSAYAKAGSSLRSPPGNSWASTPKTRVCLLYCCVLSPTPLTLQGAVPHHHLSPE